MKTNSIKYLLIFTTLIVCCWHCSCDRKKDPDPCKDIPKSTAEFVSSDNIPYIDQDTFLNNNIVFFKAKDTTANSYEWQFGDDPKKYTKSYQQKITFDETALGLIKANLKIIKKKSTYTCYPNDDSVKTYSKKIFFVSQEDIPYLGWWKGSFNNSPNDTFSFEVKKIYDEYTQKYKSISLVGFPPNCDSVSYHRDAWASYYKFVLQPNPNFWNSKPNKCRLFTNIVYSKLVGHYTNNKILIEYTIDSAKSDGTSIFKPLTFTGIRLNK